MNSFLSRLLFYFMISRRKILYNEFISPKIIILFYYYWEKNIIQWIGSPFNSTHNSNFLDIFIHRSYRSFGFSKLIIQHTIHYLYTLYPNDFPIHHSYLYIDVDITDGFWHFIGGRLIDNHIFIPFYLLQIFAFS